VIEIERFDVKKEKVLPFNVHLHPALEQKLHSYKSILHSDVDKTTEILGIESPQYTAEILKDSPLTLESLQKHLQQYPHINVLCQDPATMSLMVFVCMCQPNSLPSTVTKLYGTYITCRIVHCLKQSGKIAKDAVISKLEDIPEQSVHKTLQQLEKMSFDALMRDKVMFTTHEVPDIDPNYYGLLKFTGSTKQLSFFCYGLQEYFAAKYVSKLPYDEIYRHLNKSFPDFTKRDDYYFHHSSYVPDSKSVHLYNMWILYCGIAGEQCNQKVPAVMQEFLSSFLSNHDSYHILYRLQRSLSVASSVSPSQKSFLQQKLSSVNNEYDYPNMIMFAIYLFRCFQEAQDKNLCKTISESLNNNYIRLSPKRLFPHQVASIGFFLLNSDAEICYLNLQRCHIGDRGIHLLHQYICSDKARKCEVRAINFYRNDISGASSSLISDIVKKVQPHSLDLGDNNIDELNSILAAVTATDKVKVFRIRDNNITTQRANTITDTLTSLEQLDISYNKLDNDGAILLAKGISCSSTLKILDISGNHIGSSGFIAIINALTSNTSLEKLRMGWNAIGKDGTQAVVTESASNQTLKKFDGDHNKMGFLELEAIAKVCNSLERLSLSSNSIDQDGATGIALIINNNHALKTFYINNNNFESAIIAQTLTNNDTLETLYMEDNNFGENGAPAIATFIANNNTLKELSIRNNNFGPSGTSMIANALTSNASLEELYMDKNGIGQNGAEAFASAIANNKTLKKLSLNYDDTINEERAMIIIRSLYRNNTITNLYLRNDNCYTEKVEEEISKINSARNKVYVQYNKLVKKK